nr:hypothetical protein [uncultured bacterium]
MPNNYQKSAAILYDAAAQEILSRLQIGFGISGTVGVVALNLVLGGLIGGVILIWKLAVALWYLPLTIYRLVT